MNYITKLQTEVRTLKYNASDANIALDELVNYLLSSKFNDDTTVQVKDVLNRLQPIREALGRHYAEYLAES